MPVVVPFQISTTTTTTSRNERQTPHQPRTLRRVAPDLRAGRLFFSVFSANSATLRYGSSTQRRGGRKDRREILPFRTSGLAVPVVVPFQISTTTTTTRHNERQTSHQPRILRRVAPGLRAGRFFSSFLSVLCGSALRFFNAEARRTQRSQRSPSPPDVVTRRARRGSIPDFYHYDHHESQRKTNIAPTAHSPTRSARSPCRASFLLCVLRDLCGSALRVFTAEARRTQRSQRNPSLPNVGTRRARRGSIPDFYHYDHHETQRKTNIAPTVHSPTRSARSPCRAQPHNPFLFPERAAPLS